MLEKIIPKYSYRVYGLTVGSEIEMPELLTSGVKEREEYDAVISYGIAPREIANPIVNSTVLKVSKREFYMYVKGVAHYYVSNGNSIVVEPEEGSDDEQIRIFILGSSFGVMLKQRNTIAIHGGTAVVNGVGIIFTGSMGAGKSTLNSAFRQEEHPFLADDISVLGTESDGNIFVYPAYPQTKLCRDTMIKMSYDISRYRIVDRDRDKYAVPVNKSFTANSAPLGGIYEIVLGDISSVHISEVLGTDKLSTIMKNLYRSELISCIGYDREYFKQCLKIAEGVPVYRIIRPKDQFTVKEQVALIKNSIASSGVQAV